MNTYPTLTDYPNNRSAHQLRRYKNGVGECSCNGWHLEGASEASLIRSHQYHITNHEELSQVA
jgi:hypothetical protein